MWSRSCHIYSLVQTPHPSVGSAPKEGHSSLRSTEEEDDFLKTPPENSLDFVIFDGSSPMIKNNLSPS